MKDFLPVTITKMSGAGNTFALIDARPGSAWQDNEKSLGISRPEFVKKICNMTLGLAVDGVLFIEAGSPGFDYNWDFYNSDGSTAEMCGNAARCAARYCFESFANSPQGLLKFKTGAGLVEVQSISEKEVRVRMPEARFLQKLIELKTKSSSVEKFSLVNTGVPHLVQKIHKIEDAPGLKEMAREARSHHDLKPAGANVTFYAEVSGGRINAVTFERGVEDYTQACGTGAVAAALVYADQKGLSQVEVKMPGGLLKVQLFPDDPHPVMIGEAIFVGDFKFNFEVMNEKL